MKSKGGIFLEHIQNHIKGMVRAGTLPSNAKPACKICGKTADEIYKKETRLNAVKEHFVSQIGMGITIIIIYIVSAKYLYSGEKMLSFIFFFCFLFCMTLFSIDIFWETKKCIR